MPPFDVTFLQDGAQSAERVVDVIGGFIVSAQDSLDVAIYDFPARALAGPDFADRVVEELAGVTAPPPWWGALSVLAGWAALAAVLAWTVGDRRDIT